MRAKEIRVPASSANLGPGFDTLGLALGIYLRCRVTPSDALEITATGRDAETLPCDESNLIWQTALTIAREQERELTPVRLEVDNDIPIGKGLGSSAAALVAGVALANEDLGLGWDVHQILDAAARLEGHPDNVAAAVLGAMTTAAIDSGGTTRAVRIEIRDNFRFAIVCPDFALATSKMRTVLPECYSREDAIFNIQRATLLVGALATGVTHVFPEAFGDRLHQPFRMENVPGMDEVLAVRADGLLGCALSGAGPAILVLHEAGRESVLADVTAVFERRGHAFELLQPPICQEGLTIR